MCAQALAELSVDAARRVAHSAALKAENAWAKQEEERKKLRALADGAARRDATGRALRLHGGGARPAVALVVSVLGGVAVSARVRVQRVSSSSDLDDAL